MKIFNAIITLLSLALSVQSISIQDGVTSFITNGENETDVIPFYGYLEMFNGTSVFFGSSALISRTAVVTVAQNVEGFLQWRVGFGGKRIRELTMHSVAWAYRHDQYDPITLYNNIAVLVLTEPITPSALIAPYPLPPNGANFPMAQTIGSVIGFGFGLIDAQPEVLQTTTFRVLTQAQCADSYPHLASSNHINNYFCGEDATTEFSNFCAGDQGGPIFSRQLNILFGIASFIRSPDCNSRDSSPAAFIRLTEYYSFLEPFIDPV